MDNVRPPIGTHVWRQRLTPVWSGGNLVGPNVCSRCGASTYAPTRYWTSPCR